MTLDAEIEAETTMEALVAEVDLRDGMLKELHRLFPMYHPETIAGVFQQGWEDAQRWVGSCRDAQSIVEFASTYSVKAECALIYAIKELKLPYMRQVDALLRSRWRRSDI